MPHKCSNKSTDMCVLCGWLAYGANFDQNDYHYNSVSRNKSALECAEAQGNTDTAQAMRAGMCVSLKRPSTVLACLHMAHHTHAHFHVRGPHTDTDDLFVAMCAAIASREAPWSASNHHSRPESIKQAVTIMMMIRSLQPSSVLHHMPIEMMFEIFAAITTPSRGAHASNQ